MRSYLPKLIIASLGTLAGCVTNGTFEQYQTTIENQRRADTTEHRQQLDTLRQEHTEALKIRDDQARAREAALLAQISAITSRLDHGAFQRDDDFYTKTTAESQRIARTAIERTEQLDLENQARIRESLARNDNAVAALQSTVRTDIATLASETRTRNDELAQRVTQQLEESNQQARLLEQQLRANADQLAANIVAKEQELEGKLGTLSTDFRAQIEQYNQTLATIRSDINASMTANNESIAQIESNTRHQNELGARARQESIRTIADIRELQQRVNDVLGDPVAGTGIYQDRALAREERAKLAQVREALYRTQLSDETAGQLFIQTRTAGETFWTRFNNRELSVADRRQALNDYLRTVEESLQSYSNQNSPAATPEREK